MPPHDAERLELAHRVRKKLALENVLTPIQARSFVRSLQTTWQVPTIAWGDNESKNQLNDARRLIHVGTIFKQLEGPTSANSIGCYRRAAELLEWLSRAEDAVRTNVPIELFAGAAYQLGGLPAMADGLLKQVEFTDVGTLLYASFIRANFDNVLSEISKFWQSHIELTTPNASEVLFAEEADDKFSWYFVVEIVRCLGLISDSLRRGDNERLNRGILKLRKLDGVAVRTLSEDISLLLALLISITEGFRDASIYTPALKLANLNPDYANKMKRFARGQFSRGRGILWTSQLLGLERLLNESSFALCTPTGSGKTLVANLALVKELLLAENEGLAPLGLYLVPSRALAGEVEAKLTAELGNDFVITGLYGGSDWGITDYWLNTDRPTVLIATVEKADALMRYLGPILLARLRLLIIDEAHQVVSEDSENAKVAFAEHRSRPIRLEGLVTRLLNQSPNIVRIALTAVAGGAALPVARWIEGRADANPVGIRYRSTRQIIGMLDSTPLRRSRLLLELMNDRPLYVRGRDEAVYIGLQIPAMPQLPAKMRNSIYRFNELNVLWTALHLLEGQRRILISVTQEPEQTIRWYTEAFSLPEWQDTTPFIPPEDSFLRALFEETRAVCVDYCGDESYELALLDRGIATNHGQMPQKLRRLMTALIERRVCPITVATATLTEGVNLPFDLIFLTSLKRTFYDQAEPLPERRQKIVPLSTAEFRNLSGRAGRPGSTTGMEGMTLISIPHSPSATANATKPLQVRQIRNLQADYINLIERLLADEGGGESVVSPLALLLQSIYDGASDLLDIEDDDFLSWLEGIFPGAISEEAGLADSSRLARLADSVDELDSILLSALEELSRTENRAIEGPEAEAFLVQLWQKTFTSVAAAQEEWLERSFIRRGCAILETIYPDIDERKRLYQYGFSPHVGRRFEAISPEIKAELENSGEYGRAAPDERLATFKRLCELLENDRGFGFRVRETVIDQELLNNWEGVLAWWMQGPDALHPEPAKLRSWQRFVAENLEFRLGVGIGAVIAQAWSDGAADPLEIPSLATWRETTALPWFGFWAKELLRWGTLEPFVAFALAQGLSRTREEAAARRSEFVEWLQEQSDELEADDFINPQNFLDWQRNLPRDATEHHGVEAANVELTGTTGQKRRYNVIPVEMGNSVIWIDASGYALARSEAKPAWVQRRSFRDDFELLIERGQPTVRPIFRAG